MDYDVVVIGAGAGGLSAGATLAASGLKTLIVEQADTVGGCASSFESHGFQFDSGACIIEMPRVYDWLYRRLGLDRKEYITFLRNDPLYELVDIMNGERIPFPASLEGMAEIIGRHSPGDARTFLDFMRGKGKMLDGFADIIMTTPQGRLRDLAKVFWKYPRILANLGSLMGPYNKVLDDLFQHPYTHRLLANYSIIGGLPPSRQSSMMLWLCYLEHDGMFYPRGGMGAVQRGIARAFKDLGGELRLGARVDRLLMNRKKAGGVVLSDGTALTSRAVVSNANAKNLYFKMVGVENLPGAVFKGLNSYEPSPSCTVGYLGLDYKPPMAAQHICGLSGAELIDAFWSGLYSKNVAVPQSVGLITSPTFMDPTLAPNGCHSLSFITMAPRHPASAPWSEMKWDYLEQGIDMVNTMYVPGIKDHILFKTIATPEDFEKRLLIPGGSMYAFSMSILSQMAFRPSNRSRCVKNLYLCGASSHTGSVPGAVCSGMMAADLALEDLDGRWN